MLLGRIILIVKSWFHALLASAEDPREQFEVAQRRQQELLTRVRQARARIDASKGQLQSKVGASEGTVSDLQQRARQALSEGNEQLARFGLRMKLGSERELASLVGHIADLGQEGSKLDMIEQHLAGRIESFTARQDALEAQYSTAEAQLRLLEAWGGVSDELSGLGLALERAEERAQHMQDRAEAIEGLVDVGVLESPMDAGLQLEPGDRSDTSVIEDQIEELRQQVAKE